MFKTFPEFSRLTLSDREEYEERIRGYPPVSDIAFSTLFLAWSSLKAVKIAVLYDNLIIPYWMPGYESHSGFSIVGTNKIDESLCTVLDYLKERGEPVQLVNVPEFVIEQVRYPELFKFTAERGLDEYLIPASRLYPLESAPPLIRPRIRKFIRRNQTKTLEFRKLDLKIAANRRLLLRKIEAWRRKGTLSDLGSFEEEVLRSTVANAEDLGIGNFCLFIDGSLQGYCMYRLIPGCEYADIFHFKFDAHVPYLFEFLAHKTMEHLVENGAETINIQADLGLMRVRIHKLLLGPSNFFRKYKIRTAM